MYSACTSKPTRHPTTTDLYASARRHCGIRQNVPKIQDRAPRGKPNICCTFHRHTQISRRVQEGPSGTNTLETQKFGRPNSEMSSAERSTRLILNSLYSSLNGLEVCSCKRRWKNCQGIGCNLYRLALQRKRYWSTRQGAWRSRRSPVELPVDVFQNEKPGSNSHTETYITEKLP